MRMTSILLFTFSVQVRVGQQREEARALDRVRQLALVAGGGAGDTRRDDLAGLVDEVLERLDVFVVDPLGFLGGEAAELAAAEQRPLPFVLLVLAELPFAFPFTSARRWHLALLQQIRCSSHAGSVFWSACSSLPETPALSGSFPDWPLRPVWLASRMRWLRLRPGCCACRRLRPARTRVPA